jgi:hypothetical protein
VTPEGPAFAPDCGFDDGQDRAADHILKGSPQVRTRQVSWKDSLKKISQDLPRSRTWSRKAERRGLQGCVSSGRFPATRSEVQSRCPRAMVSRWSTTRAILALRPQAVNEILRMSEYPRKQSSQLLSAEHLVEPTAPLKRRKMCCFRAGAGRYWPPTGVAEHRSCAPRTRCTTVKTSSDDFASQLALQ